MEYVQFRWVGEDLQYRTRVLLSDASGAFCQWSEDWTEWQSVPHTV